MRALAMVVIAAACGKSSSQAEVRPHDDAARIAAQDARVAPAADAAVAPRFPSPPEPTAFAIAPAANDDHTSLAGGVVLTPRSLVALFGAPYVSDPAKVSGTYVFAGGDLVFTVYDWKDAAGTEDGCGPPPAVFWTTDRPYDFHVAGRGGDVHRFEAWLRAQVSIKLRRLHAKHVAELEDLLDRFWRKELALPKVIAAAKSLRARWNLAALPVPKLTAPRPRPPQTRLREGEPWSTARVKTECDVFVKSDSNTEAPWFGNEDPRSLWAAVLDDLVHADELDEDALDNLHAFAGARPGEEANAWNDAPP